MGVKPLTDNEVYELRCALAAFKSDLPPHDLSRWYITRRSTESVVEDSTETHRLRWRDGIQICGYGECGRCRKRFDIPAIGNFTTYEESLALTVQSAKEWVERIARQDGPCWGDVPRPPPDVHGAVLDG